MKRKTTSQQHISWWVGVILIVSSYFLTGCQKEDSILPSSAYSNPHSWFVTNVNFGIDSTSWIRPDSCKVLYFDSLQTTTSLFTASYGYSTDGPTQKSDLQQEVAAKMLAAAGVSIVVRGQLWVRTDSTNITRQRVVGVNPITAADANLRQTTIVTEE